MNTKMIERNIKNKQNEIISSINQLTEYNEVDSLIIKTFYGLDAGKNAIMNIQDSLNQIDLVITDLNMEDGYSGCDVIKEIVKRNPELPVYVVSNSLSEYFDISSNTCETLQSSTNNVVNIYKNCCLLPNVLGVSDSKSGKLQIGEIVPLFQRFINYKKKIVEIKENNLASQIQNANISVPQVKHSLTKKSSLLTKFRSIIKTNKIAPQKSSSITQKRKISPQRTSFLKKNRSITPQKSSLLTKIRSIMKTRKITPQKSSLSKKIRSMVQRRKIIPQHSLNKIIPSAGG